MPIVAGVLLLAVIVPAAAHADPFVNPVIAGDFPDPSVTRLGGDYWAVGTSGDFAPAFPLMHSTDLVNWQQLGAVFDRPPSWTAGAYWAPQLTQWHNRFLLYYAARKRGAHPCIGLAVARSGAGPYEDRGPLLCRGNGAIDPMLFVDPTGQPWLLWKDMGFGRGIRIQPTNPDGTRLVGRSTLLIHPDQPWELGVTENPYMVAHNGSYYLFYSGGHCCKPPCSYAVGVASAPSPTGPFVKEPSSQRFGTNDEWECPGAATLIDDPDGETFFAYHAYRPGQEYLGRQTLLDHFSWDDGPWPVLGDGSGPTAEAAAPAGAAQRPPGPYDESFDERALGAGWQWRWDRRPDFRLVNGALRLAVATPGNELSAVIGRRATTANYTATAVIDRTATTPDALAGIAIDGGSSAILGAGIQNGALRVWQHGPTGDITVTQAPIAASQMVWVRLAVSGGTSVAVSVSTDGSTFYPVGSGPYPLPSQPSVEWVRLTLGAPQKAAARFMHFTIVPDSE